MQITGPDESEAHDRPGDRHEDAQQNGIAQANGEGVVCRGGYRTLTARGAQVAGGDRLAYQVAGATEMPSCRRGGAATPFACRGRLQPGRIARRV